PLPSIAITNVILRPATNIITKVTNIIVPAVDIFGCNIIKIKNRHGTTNRGKTHVVKDLISSYLFYINFAVINIVTNFAISDGCIVNAPKPNQRLATFALIPNGVNTKSSNITDTIPIGLAFFFQHLSSILDIVIIDINPKIA